MTDGQTNYERLRLFLFSFMKNINYEHLVLWIDCSELSFSLPEELLAPLRGENHLGPRPVIEILVPFRGSFQNFRRASPSFLSKFPWAGNPRIVPPSPQSGNGEVTRSGKQARACGVHPKQKILAAGQCHVSHRTCSQKSLRKFF